MNAIFGESNVRFLLLDEKPMHEFVGPMRYAIDIGMRMGDMNEVGAAAGAYGILLVLCQIGTLPATIQEVETFRYIMIHHNLKDHLVFTECNLQFCHKLVYEQDDCCSLNGEIMQLEDMYAVAKENNDLILAAIIEYNKMMLNVYFGQPIAAAESAKKNVDVGFKICQGCHFVPRNAFFVGLSMVLAHRADGKSKGFRFKTANLSLKRFEAWMKSGNPNVLHFSHLLRAELK